MKKKKIKEGKSEEDEHYGFVGSRDWGRPATKTLKIFTRGKKNYGKNKYIF
jgi:hypothetical protein